LALRRRAAVQSSRGIIIGNSSQGVLSGVVRNDGALPGADLVMDRCAVEDVVAVVEAAVEIGAWDNLL
jgi:hypothetical protein